MRYTDNIQLHPNMAKKISLTKDYAKIELKDLRFFLHSLETTHGSIPCPAASTGSCFRSPVSLAIKPTFFFQVWHWPLTATGLGNRGEGGQRLQYVNSSSTSLIRACLFKGLITLPRGSGWGCWDVSQQLNFGDFASSS